MKPNHQRRTQLVPGQPGVQVIDLVEQPKGGRFRTQLNLQSLGGTSEQGIPTTPAPAVGSDRQGRSAPKTTPTKQGRDTENKDSKSPKAARSGKARSN